MNTLYFWRCEVGVTTVRLTDEMEKQIDQLASSTQRSKGAVIKQALNEFIEKKALEELRWQQTLDAIESVANGEFVDGDNVHKWIRSWGSEDELSTPGS
jgi:predicted transcriptional regulator